MCTLILSLALLPGPAAPCPPNLTERLWQVEDPQWSGSIYVYQFLPNGQSLCWSIKDQVKEPAPYMGLWEFRGGRLTVEEWDMVGRGNIRTQYSWELNFRRTTLLGSLWEGDTGKATFTRFWP